MCAVSGPVLLSRVTRGRKGRRQLAVWSRRAGWTQQVPALRSDWADELGVTFGPLVRPGVCREMMCRDITRLGRWLVIGGMYQFKGLSKKLFTKMSLAIISDISYDYDFF